MLETPDMLCLELGRLAAEPTPPCVTARPPRPRPSYAIAPSVSSEATTARGEQAGRRNPKAAPLAHRGAPRDRCALPGGDAPGRHARSAAGLPPPKLGGPGLRRRALGQGQRRRLGPDRSSDVEYRGGCNPSRLQDTRGEGDLGRGRGSLGVEEAAARRRGRLVGLGGLGGDAAARQRGSRPSWKRPPRRREAVGGRGRGGAAIEFLVVYPWIRHTPGTPPIRLAHLSWCVNMSFKSTVLPEELLGRPEAGGQPPNFAN